MANILLTGGSGLLAMNWACHMRNLHDVTLAVHTKKVNLHRVNTIKLDLASTVALTDKICQVDPDAVIHTAGLTSVDECEIYPLLANQVNCELAANVALVCRQLDKKLVHISTDHLFSGEKAYCREDEIPCPANAYARSKLCAEEAVHGIDPTALIVRTNFFGWGHRFRRSLSDWIIESLKNDREITMFDDVYFTPILIDHAVEIIHGLLGAGASGAFNVVSDERLSKYDFARLLANKFDLPGANILHGEIAALKLAAIRPGDMSLDNAKVKKYLGLGAISITNQLDMLKLQLQEGRAQEIGTAIREN